MFFAPGTTLSTERGQRALVQAPLGDPGGQGGAFSGIILRTGEHVALKVFKDASPELWARCQHLVALDLGGVSEVFAAPSDLFRHGGLIGHVAKLVPGKTLKERLEDPIPQYPERIRIAIGVAHLVALLHERDAIHGDIQPLNFMISETGGGLQVFGIDLDNLVTTKFPTPLMAGHPEWFAPEIRKALAQGQRVRLTKETDSYALSVLLHDILLWKHPASAAKGADDFERLMQSPWAFDPVSPQTAEVPCDGYPVRMLSPALAAAFRGGLSPDPARRPSPAAWRKLLSDALFQVFVHDCGGPVFVSGAITECPFCARPFPKFGLHAPGGGLLVVIAGSDVRIGRKELRGSTTARPLEVVGRKIGPETYLEVIPGGGGVFRITRAGAIRIPEGSRALIKAGDILRIADVECHVHPEGGYCAPVAPVHAAPPAPAPAAPVPPSPVPLPPAPRPKRRISWGMVAKCAVFVALTVTWFKAPQEFREAAHEKVSDVLAQLVAPRSRDEDIQDLRAWTVPAERPGTETNGLGMILCPLPQSDGNVAISVFETRVRDYLAFVDATSRPWAGRAHQTGLDEPVTWVTWFDAKEFCGWLTFQERQAGRLVWEEHYAIPDLKHLWWAAGFTTSPDTSLSGQLPEQGWNLLGRDDFRGLANVGSFRPNALGLHDVIGNAWEWSLAEGGFGKGVLVGGSFADRLPKLREVGFRIAYPYDNASGNVGFRVVLKRAEAGQARGGKP